LSRIAFRTARRRSALLGLVAALLAAVPVAAAEPSSIGPSTGTEPYVLPSLPGVSTTSILTVGDTVGGYPMVGIPDGLGAFDNHDGQPGRGGRDNAGTFTLLMNHEIGPAQGAVHDHGATGAFISRWVINKGDLSVVSGEDQIKTVYTQNEMTGAFSVAPAYAFNRFCSADLASQTAFWNPATGLGTQDMIYLNGEENRPPFGAYGKAWAHVVSGPLNGTTYELNDVGEASWENVIASPYAQDTTIVMGLDDATNRLPGADYDPTNPPSEVYVYIGQKQRTGTPIERAGLATGELFGVKVTGDPTEATVAGGERFTLSSHGDAAQDDGELLQAESAADGVTQFRRVEDGHWDPARPNDFYFTTTDTFGGTTRLFRLRFDDITDPNPGGRIDIVVDSGPIVPGEMFDNMTVDDAGARALLQEDPGGNDYLARIWQSSFLNGKLTELAHHNPEFFAPGGSSFLTNNEESSGIIDVSRILGPGWFLLDVQAHYALDPTLVEGGQLLALRAPQAGR